MNAYEECSTWWEHGRKMKGLVSLRAKRYLRKVEDMFELWDRKPDEGGLCIATVAPNGDVTLKNVEQYNSRRVSMLWLFNIRGIRKLRQQNIKELNYAWFHRYLNTPVADGTVFNGGGLVSTIRPLRRVVSKDTKKKVRDKLKEYRSLMRTTLALLQNKVDRGDYRLEFQLPAIDDPVDGGAMLRLLEWSRCRTSKVHWKSMYDSRGFYTGGGYKENPAFGENLIGKCLRVLSDKWYKEATDTQWEPA